jgi:hypothetical protein
LTTTTGDFLDSVEQNANMIPGGDEGIFDTDIALQIIAPTPVISSSWKK